jgi:hypothetical protein
MLDRPRVGRRIQVPVVNDAAEWMLALVLARALPAGADGTALGVQYGPQREHCEPAPRVGERRVFHADRFDTAHICPQLWKASKTSVLTRSRACSGVIFRRLVAK